MRALATLVAAEIAKRVPFQKGSTQMLDIGGSHGYQSVAICRRHPGLHSTILDLPQAVQYSEPILAREQMHDRVAYRAGNALVDDLGSETFDLVYIGNVVHHFTEEENRDLARRVARALRPGGYYVICDLIRPSSPREAGQLGTIGDLFFALTSESGTWSLDEMADWQRQAALEPQKGLRLRTSPGAGMQAAKKPG
jgi:SAM-dependent methyltransferase